MNPLRDAHLHMTRRGFLRSSVGVGSTALATMLAQDLGMDLRSSASFGLGDLNGKLLNSAAMPASINTLFPGLLAQSGFGGGLGADATDVSPSAGL